MIYTIEIDSQSRAGRNLVNFLKDLSKTMKGIQLIETVEDNELLAKMLRAKKSGRVNKEDITKTLKELTGK